MTTKSGATELDWKKEALALVVLLRAKCSDEEWATMESRFAAATPQVTPTLKEILKQYGAHHIRDCDALNKWTKLPCDCGFAALIEGTSEQASPTHEEFPSRSQEKRIRTQRGEKKPLDPRVGTPKGTK